MLQGPLDVLPAQLKQLGALPLAERPLRLGSARKRWLPIVILAVAMVAAGSGTVPAAVAFFATASVAVISGALPVNDAYKAIEWPILIMLGALISVSASLQTTGAFDIIASGLANLAVQLPP